MRFEVLNFIREIDVPDADDCYIWGLTYYNSDDDCEHHLDLALEKFLQAFELNSTHFMACLYVAHCYQDKRNFQQALKYYVLVNQEELRAFQIWRYVKLIEQIGFCHHRLGNPGLGRKQFVKVLEWYRKLPIEDRAVPTEMMQCLSETDEIVIEMKKIEMYLDETTFGSVRDEKSVKT